MNSKQTAKFHVVLSMLIYGTLGIFVRYIPLPSATISMIRGMIGAPFIFLLLLVRKSRISWTAIKENLIRLCLLGIMLGVNWILLFESYRYTSVATATLCYYFAPILIVAVSPFVFGEKMTLKKVLCIAVALVGMVFISGVAENGIPALTEIKGILLGIGAAILYAAIVINNKKLHNISAYDRTIAQLVISAGVLLPYNFLCGNLEGLSFTPTTLILLAILGIVHTGISYYFYFGAMDKLDSQTLAILSYIDPAVAILLSACVLREALSLFDIAGAILILGAAVASEYTPSRSKTKNLP